MTTIVQVVSTSTGFDIQVKTWVAIVLAILIVARVIREFM